MTIPQTVAKQQAIANPAHPSLPPGTRLVLEIPDPDAPGGFRCETPLIGTLVAALAPAVVAHVRQEKALREAAQAAAPATAPLIAPLMAPVEAPAEVAAAPAPVEPALTEAVPAEAAPPRCPKCGRDKDRIGGGRWMCRLCQQAAIRDGVAKKQAAGRQAAAREAV